MPISRAGRCSKKAVSLLRRLAEASFQLSAVRKVLSHNAFTLLELIVVIFVLSLLVGLVIPAFYGTGSGGLRSDAGRMASLLRYLNDSAISRKETIPLKISLDNSVFTWKGSEGEKSEKFNALSVISTTSTGKVSKGEVTVFFGPAGLQENIDVTIRDGKQEMHVLFNPLSGRVKIIQNLK